MLLLLQGCAQRLVVIDRMGYETTLRQAELSSKTRVQLLLGETSWEVPLRNIQSLEIDSASYKVVNGQIYYPVKMLLKNPGVAAPRERSKFDESQTYIGVGATISGKTANGSFSIPLSKVAQIKGK